MINVCQTHATAKPASGPKTPSAAILLSPLIAIRFGLSSGLVSASHRLNGIVMIVPITARNIENPRPSVRLICRSPAIGARNQFQLFDTTRPVTGIEIKKIRPKANVHVAITAYSFNVDMDLAPSGD